jgi:hypothetical protein
MLGVHSTLMTSNAVVNVITTVTCWALPKHGRRAVHAMGGGHRHINEAETSNMHTATKAGWFAVRLRVLSQCVVCGGGLKSCGLAVLL